ncbi:hypothetical protein WDU94_006626 [Cyamophila willieti]
MLKSGHCPRSFREGRTILIFKGHDEKNLKNWRPITIYSILRRIIEKVLDLKLRDEIELNTNQRGFIKGVQGCHINTKIIDACLRDAKTKKKDCIVSFLDVSDAFSNIGHNHLLKSLESAGVSNQLRTLTNALILNNSIRIECNQKYSNHIQLCRGVSQGSPISPLLFNLAVDYVYKELCDPSYTKRFGYELNDEFDAVSLTGFADDKAITSNSIQSAINSIELLQSLFQKIGLHINPDKSTCIAIIKGSLWTGTPGLPGWNIFLPFW